MRKSRLLKSHRTSAARVTSSLFAVTGLLVMVVLSLLAIQSGVIDVLNQSGFLR